MIGFERKQLFPPAPARQRTEDHEFVDWRQKVRDERDAMIGWQLPPLPPLSAEMAGHVVIAGAKAAGLLPEVDDTQAAESPPGDGVAEVEKSEKPPAKRRFSWSRGLG